MKDLFDRFKLGKVPVHLIIIGILGLIFLILGNPLDGEEELIEKKPEESTINREKLVDSSFGQENLYKRELENSLSTLLSSIQGIGEVEVMIQLEGGRKLEIAKEPTREAIKTTETDAGGGERIIEEEFMEEEILMTRKGGEDKPIVLRKLKPDISGVFIVAEGSENINIKKELIEAVSSFLDVPYHKIKILPYEK